MIQQSINTMEGVTLSGRIELTCFLQPKREDEPWLNAAS